MQKLVLLATLAVGLLAASSASAATPKPWYWTPTKAAARLTAIGPLTFDGGETGNNVYGAGCGGLGRGVVSTTDRTRRYTRFACTFRLGSTNGSYNYGVILRVLPLGSGKLCLDTKASATYIFDAERQRTKNLFPVFDRMIKDASRVCP